MRPRPCLLGTEETWDQGPPVTKRFLLLLLLLLCYGQQWASRSVPCSNLKLQSGAVSSAASAGIRYHPRGHLVWLMPRKTAQIPLRLFPRVLSAFMGSRRDGRLRPRAWRALGSSVITLCRKPGCSLICSHPWPCGVGTGGSEPQSQQAVVACTERTL